MVDRRSEASTTPLPAAMTPSLVLLSCGSPEQIAALHRQASSALASRLGLALAAPLGAADQTLEQAARELGRLAQPRLVPLALDAGRSLSGGGCWAEVLGAARQCCLLLLSAEQLSGGSAAAGHALLQRWQVPVLGLVQAGGDWDAAARRNDALPWLGALDSDDLAVAARLRWQLLQGF
jgi:hypothetical protein